MSSIVGPAVTRTVSPSRSPLAPRPGPGAPLDASTAMAASTIASGSASRPRPSHPQARYPDPGSTTCTPRARRISRFSRTAGWSNMFTFMAGATTTGARVAI